MLTFFNILIRYIWFMISCDFIFYFDDIKLAKIIKLMIFDFLKFVIYEAHRRLNINEVYKNHRFKHWIALHAILRFIFLYSIENVSKVTVWSSNHVNLVNDNTIEMNFDDLLLEVLHFFLVREFDLVNSNSVDLRIHSLHIKLINAYDSNKKTRFRKYINLQCVFNWCLFVWLIHKNVHFQLYNDSRRQFIWCCIIKIVNDT